MKHRHKGGRLKRKGHGKRKIKQIMGEGGIVFEFDGGVIFRPKNELLVYTVGQCIYIVFLCFEVAFWADILALT
jgi:hypothetical protein